MKQKESAIGTLNIILIIVIIILIILGGIFVAISKREDAKYEDYPTIIGVIVEVYDKSIIIMEIGENNTLYSAGFGDEGNIGFKKGQEVQVYYSGEIQEIYYPRGLQNVHKIKILKEKSDIEIPERIIRSYYSSPTEVSTAILEITNKGIAFTIMDANKLPYNYSRSYILKKSVYVGDAIYTYTPGTDEANQNVTANQGTVPRYEWKELETISNNISSEETEEGWTAENKDKMYDFDTRKFNWTQLYGELQERKISICFRKSK